MKPTAWAKRVQGYCMGRDGTQTARDLCSQGGAGHFISSDSCSNSLLKFRNHLELNIANKTGKGKANSNKNLLIKFHTKLTSQFSGCVLLYVLLYDMASTTRLAG